MPMFRRRPTRSGSPPGTLSCSQHGCGNRTAMPCSYCDRRGRVCAVAFCPDHWAMVGGVVYCRRHAGTMIALGPNIAIGALPELENRGPSLVNWVAAEIGAEVEELLRATAREGETVKSDAEVSVVFDHRRRRRWERSWKLIEATGISLAVSLTVNDDEDDALIDVRVGANVIARGVPPWIARRRAGLNAGGQVDTDQRELFHRFFINHIAEAVALERSPDRPLAV